MSRTPLPTRPWLDSLRDGWRGLTVRGRAFLAAGLTAVVCSVLLGQTGLARVGVLIAVLPVLAVVVVGRGRYRLALVRTVSPTLVTAGQPATVTLSLTNEGRTPSGTLMLEDHVPYALGTRPRFVLEGIGHGWRRHVRYQVRSDLRGQFPIGPMSVRVSDPFGLVELGRSFTSVTKLTVTPRTVPLPAIPLGGSLTGTGDNRPRAFASGSAEDVTVREYRQGDDLRRVHWRSSAKLGELMVRREEQPWQSRATLFVDNRRRAHRGQGAASTLEAAVSTAASIAVHLSQRGYSVRMVTAAGSEADSVWHTRESRTNIGPLLESLAVLGSVSSTTLDSDWLAEPGHGGLMIAVFGHLEAHDVPVVRRMLHHSSTAMAIALDVDAWTGAAAATRPGALLVGQGWRTAVQGPRDRLDTVWQELGRANARLTSGPALHPATP